MKILLHVCCAPCATYPFRTLEEQGHRVDGFFYNPNIHPSEEHRRRREAVEKYARQSGHRIIFSPTYDFENFLRLIANHETERCRRCWNLRLKQTALEALKMKYEAFTSTLLISRHQDHEQVKEIAEGVSRETGMPFFYQDFRSGWKEHWKLTEQYDLYKQQYCGCVYSEYERFMAKA